MKYKIKIGGDMAKFNKNWTTWAHEKRMKTGGNEPWWELLPDDEKEKAEKWIKENADSFYQYFGSKK